MKLQRLGLIMQPESGNLMEVEGVLNPAAIRCPDGNLYLFPRLVGKKNYSRIGIAKVKFNDDGDPIDAVRMGIALEPEAEYELRSDGSGGCEDARVTYFEPLKRYIMTYTALSPKGPRIALAISQDLFEWKRIGLARFESFLGIDFANVDNKDAILFPLAIPNHKGKMQIAILHRPLFQGSRPEEVVYQPKSRIVDIEHESIWISYCPIPKDISKFENLGLFNSHHRLATPVSSWERLKIGGGTPPILTRFGWLILYHGVSLIESNANNKNKLRYSAGVMILSKDHPQHIHFRSIHPVLTPESEEERLGTVSNVVFPTGIDQRNDLGLPDRFDIYYDMADSSIGVARLNLPEILPKEGVADAPNKKV